MTAHCTIQLPFPLELVIVKYYPRFRWKIITCGRAGEKERIIHSLISGKLTLVDNLLNI